MSALHLHVNGGGTVSALGDPEAIAAVAMAIRHRQELLDAVDPGEPMSCVRERKGRCSHDPEWNRCRPCRIAAVAARVREEMES